ncbi:hypothetical protein RND81_04G217200 [Saponaria officinalis]|uniref:Transcription factor MYB1 n=1 Tax=Saponaria officinalis TaxID=3572 RepID=A0AAW1LNU2_SAPOF
MGGVAWSEEEDNLLRKCIQQYGEGKWHRIPLLAGINRCRKSCRLRWLNYLRPNIKRGKFTDEEVEVIVKLHKLLGNRWSLIAGRLPGRTANDVKNYWHCHLNKRLNSSSKNETTKNNSKKQVNENLSPKNEAKSDASHAYDHGHLAYNVSSKEILYENINNVDHEKDGKISLEESITLEELSTDIDFDLEEINITEGDRKCNWDFDDLLFDMDLLNKAL